MVRGWSVRPAGGAQLNSQSHGAFASYRVVSHLRRHHLRNRRPRVVLRVPARDLLRQPHPSVFHLVINNINIIFIYFIINFTIYQYYTDVLPTCNQHCQPCRYRRSI